MRSSFDDGELLAVLGEVCERQWERGRSGAVGVLPRFARVCRQWAAVARSPPLWQRLLAAHFACTAASADFADSSSSSSNPWREEYRRRMARCVVASMSVRGDSGSGLDARFFSRWLNPENRCSVSVAVGPGVPLPSALLSGGGDRAVLSFEFAAADAERCPRSLLTDAFRELCAMMLKPEAQATPSVAFVDAGPGQLLVRMSVSCVLVPKKESRRAKAEAVASARMFSSRQASDGGAPPVASSARRRPRRRREDLAGHANDPLQRLAASRFGFHFPLLTAIGAGSTAWPLFKALRALRKGDSEGEVHRAEFRVPMMRLQGEFRSNFLQLFGFPCDYVGSSFSESQSAIALDVHLSGLNSVTIGHASGSGLEAVFNPPCSILHWLLGRIGGQAAFEKSAEQKKKITLDDGTTLAAIEEWLETEMKEQREKYKAEHGGDSDRDSFYEEAKGEFDRSVARYGHPSDSSASESSGGDDK